MKYTMTKIKKKNLLRGFNCRLEMTEKIISEPKDRSIEFTDMYIKEKTD